MHRPFTIFAVVAMLAVASPARAQRPVRVALAGGWALPAGTSTFTDPWNGGGAFSAGLVFRVRPRLNLWTEIGFSRLRFDAGAFGVSLPDSLAGVQVNGNDLRIVPVMAGAELALTSWGNTRPYLAGGCGYYWASVAEGTASGPGSAGVDLPDPSGEAFGARLGLGVRTLVAPTVVLFADVAVHVAWLQPEALEFVVLRLGLRF